MVLSFFFSNLQSTFCVQSDDKEYLIDIMFLHI